MNTTDERLAAEGADWIRLTVLPPLRRHPDGIDELRLCVCQAPPSDWLGGIEEPEARLWNRDGRDVAWGRAGEETKFLGPRHLVQVWRVNGACRRAAAVAAGATQDPA